MLKKRDLYECGALFDLMRDPDVFPFVREKASTAEEYLFKTKQIIEAEEANNVISRTIIDEWSQPIGTITLYDIDDGAGFLGTWLGKPYFGVGYNQKAKEAFFSELFYERDIKTIFMKIRKTNLRSQKAALKIPYVKLADDFYPDVYNAVNGNGTSNHLFVVTREHYLQHQQRIQLYTAKIDELKEA
ncbi:RimJ/RimL family protein N-acetyltransferase [Scopulibacillus darangshiensis]|uniref:RimJ/RimL family protein N-acetyltransferase n=1 Tax=Scopulibacillus darangshiensis TaxID=442528 RepID=A0A4V2SLS7_9BACL|nr:GNAT family N-acetyltransferase [Scopulibacillus darangshiensis]TCP24546.1 RimJ/RimL family protein N-acetyltransferase [Scopulibacillus darangshiensis]